MKIRIFYKFFLLLFLLLGCTSSEDEYKKREEASRRADLIWNTYFLQSLFFYPYNPYDFNYPPYVNYFQYNNVFQVGVKISDIKPYDSFSFLNSSYTYTVSPELPAGLSLNTSTGIISGTPTTSQAITTYTIKVSNSSGSSESKITIRIGNTVATGVFGQGGSFTTNVANSGGVTSSSLNNPTSFFSYSYYGYTTSSSSDSYGVRYIVDSGNNRVLIFNSDSYTANGVFGQGGSLSSNTANNGGVSSTSLSMPTSISSYYYNYLSDTANHRVLSYAGSYSGNYSITANTVYGQGGSLSSSTANNGGISASSLNGPTGVSSDGSNLYVADTGNNRVLKYSSTFITASIVYGQGGSFSSGNANNGGVSASSLNAPSAVFYDYNNSGVYIVDKGNNRVLYYSGSSLTGSLVYGQGGSFSSNAINNGGVSADSLNSPSGVVVDKAKGVYIADTGNNRVLYYPSGSTTATRVFGQGGSFTTNAVNNGGISASSLNSPQSVNIDYSGNLYIVDTGNNRVLLY